MLSDIADYLGIADAARPASQCRPVLVLRGRYLCVPTNWHRVSVLPLRSNPYRKTVANAIAKQTESGAVVQRRREHAHPPTIYRRRSGLRHRQLGDAGPPGAPRRVGLFRKGLVVVLVLSPITDPGTDKRDSQYRWFCVDPFRCNRPLIAMLNQCRIRVHGRIPTTSRMHLDVHVGNSPVRISAVSVVGDGLAGGYTRSV